MAHAARKSGERISARSFVWTVREINETCVVCLVFYGRSLSLFISFDTSQYSFFVLFVRDNCNAFKKITKEKKKRAKKLFIHV